MAGKARCGGGSLTGAATGPILGGALVETFGFPSLGVAAIVTSICAVALFAKVHAPARPPVPAPEAAMPARSTR